ncbi:MAG: rhodanese-like domain-containing protein [Gammaproteobacteria bacterium]|nr:rhodanese-like domain-containing protein [Gammaproteobacteria bacterium]MDH5653330.1 rhodanese-like domain-containing protein [Gammaproteobacteria bacterium]
MKPVIYLLLLLSQLLLHSNLVVAAGNEYPGRKLYLAVPVIELDDLYNKRKSSVIVDVRSAYEFNTLRIKNALNIPLSDDDFISKMKRLREASGGNPIVVYCNGKTCLKSYKAVAKCRSNNINNVIAYDAGMMDWARKYPDESVLLGKSPINPDRLISKANFNKHLLNPKEFEAMVGGDNVIVLDVRDQFQREGISIFVKKEKRAPLDAQATVDKYIQEAKQDNRVLLIYDQAGKQVEWLMYHLEDKGLRSYYFMKGGARAYFEELRKEFVR